MMDSTGHQTDLQTEEQTQNITEQFDTIQENFKNLLETTDDLKDIEVETIEVKEEQPTPTTKVVRRKKKKKVDEPLKKVVDFAKTFSSTGAAFILATLGVITQTFHNGFLAFELSSFDDFWLRLFQAILCAFFVSGALLYFTVRSANDGDNKTITQLVWGFFAFEVFCNIYYWANKYIILPWGTDDVVWSSMIIAIPFSIIIPFTIKAYAGELKFTSDDTDDEYEEIEVPNNIDIDTVMERVNMEVSKHLNEYSTETLDVIDKTKTEIKKRFDMVDDDIKTIKKRSDKAIEIGEKAIKDGESFKLNLNTTNKTTGENEIKTLNATIHK